MNYFLNEQQATIRFWFPLYQTFFKMLLADLCVRKTIFWIFCTVNIFILSCYLCVFPPEHQKMCYTALVLTMIFSMGEQVPYHHYGTLNIFTVYKAPAGLWHILIAVNDKVGELRGISERRFNKCWICKLWVIWPWTGKLCEFLVTKQLITTRLIIPEYFNFELRPGSATLR